MEMLNILEKLADIIDERPAEEIKGFIKGMIFSMYLKESFIQGIEEGIEEAVEQSKSSSSKNDNKFYERKDAICRTNFNQAIQDIIFESRERALDVMSELDDILENDGEVTVRDFYIASELSTYNYMMRFYGWRDISSFTITGDRENGFHIHMPPVISLA